MNDEDRSPASLFGKANEASITCNNVNLTALLDTGSTVSTISQQCYEEYFPDLDLCSIKEILSIECANGESLPYSGFIVLDVEVSGMADLGPLPTILLVVSNSNYNKRVPVLLGTNFLCPLLEQCRNTLGHQFSQKILVPSPVDLSFRCISQCAKDLSRSGGRIAHIQNDTLQNVFISPNCSIMLKGRLTKKIIPISCLAMIHNTDGSYLPEGVEISPCLVNVESDTTMVSMELSNHTDQRVILPPSCLLAELQQVKNENPSTLQCRLIIQSSTKMDTFCH